MAISQKDEQDQPRLDKKHLCPPLLCSHSLLGTTHFIPFFKCHHMDMINNI
jgi:hypothetical protein